MSLRNNFPPLQGAIAQAESWTQYLNAQRDRTGTRRPDEAAAALENLVWAGVHLGEVLPFTWRLAFDNLLRPGAASWATVKEFEANRQEVRRLFFTVREAMDRFRSVAEALQSVVGRPPQGMDRLLEAIENARRLEESVFRAWPSFAESTPAVGHALPVDESLAETLGLSIEEARQKMAARRRERNAKPG